MIIPETKIYKACHVPKGKDDGHPILEAVHYNAEQKRLEAANGFILAVCPVESPNGDLDALVPVDAIKQAHKLGRRVNDKPALKIGEDGVRPGKVEFSSWADDKPFFDEPIPFPETDKKYPDVNQIVPPEDQREFVLAISADLLKDLADAICTDSIHGVELFWTKNAKEVGPIYVRPLLGDDNGNFGVIMPMKGKDRS